MIYRADERVQLAQANHSGEVPLGAVISGAHQLSFRLDGFGGATSQLDVSAVLLAKNDIGWQKNQPPVSNAGPARTVNPGMRVALDGSASRDPDNGPSPLAYNWTQSNGPAANLLGANTATPSFIPLQAGVYTFGLTVSDGQSNGAQDSVAVTVNNVPFIVLLSPNGGESWKANSKQTIRWASGGIHAKRLPTLSFSANNGKKWTVIKANAKNTGSLAWKPTKAQATQTALVKICLPKTKTDPALCDGSDGGFTIVK